MDKTYLVMQSQGNFTVNEEKTRDEFRHFAGRLTVNGLLTNALPLPNKDGDVWLHALRLRKKRTSLSNEKKV